jgi:sarcosine oxidase subunit gamma
VGVSHRNVAFSVTGKNSEAAISAGCPQDLSLRSFPVRRLLAHHPGKESRSWSTGTAEDTFRVECWRSFSDYVRDLPVRGRARRGA